jgi:hypothetical protein
MTRHRAAGVDPGRARTAARAATAIRVVALAVAIAAGVLAWLGDDAGPVATVVVVAALAVAACWHEPAG